MSKRDKYPEPDLDDIVTYYFIYNRLLENEIIGWSDDKNLAEFYLEFHKCKDIFMKKLKMSNRKMISILNQNINSRIELYWVHSKLKNKDKYFPMPITTDEWSILIEEKSVYCGNTVNYSNILEGMQLLRKKYVKALHELSVYEIARGVMVGDEENMFLAELGFDDIMLLTKIYPVNFGLTNIS